MRAEPRLCVIGHPIGHSLSPVMQQAGLERARLAWRYEAVDLPPAALGAWVARERQEEALVGFNVTLPHKQAIVPHLDRLSREAYEIGAVNTVVCCDHEWVGCNTDAPGLLDALREGGLAVKGGRVLVLGTGGAARAAIYALVQAGASTVRVLGRHAERAAGLARAAGGWAANVGGGTAVDAARWPRDVPAWADALRDRTLLIQATSVGMWPDGDACPIPDAVRLPPGLSVCDLVYRPSRTRLLARAEAAGVLIVGGLSLLLHQGVRSFALWTGRPPDVEAMRTALQRATEGAQP